LSLDNGELNTNIRSIMRNPKLEEELVKNVIEDRGLPVNAQTIAAFEKQLLNNKVVFKNYPETTRGGFYSGNEQIELNEMFLPQQITGKPGYIEKYLQSGASKEMAERMTFSSMVSTLLHEQQHYVQLLFNHFGFGTPKFRSESPKNGWAKYANQSHERESRNVQERMDEIWPENVHPWETVDEDFVTDYGQKNSTDLWDYNSNARKIVNRMGYDPDLYEEAVSSIWEKSGFEDDSIFKLSPLKVIELPNFQQTYNELVNKRENPR